MTLNLGPIEQATTKFFVFAKKFGKNVWQHSHDKRYTTFNLNTVRSFHCSVDIDYADTCWYSHWLRGHDVGIASLTMQMRCLHSHWLREQSHFEIEYLLRKQKISLNCFSLSIRAGAQTELLSKKRSTTLQCNIGLFLKHRLLNFVVVCLSLKMPLPKELL